jgi:hypothetical protein
MASILEDLMVEIRVALPDDTGAHALLRRLAGLFDLSCISFDASRNEVRVCSEWESRSAMRVIDTIESWLTADGLGSAKLSIEGRSLPLVGLTWPVTAGEQA